MVAAFQAFFPSNSAQPLNIGMLQGLGGGGRGAQSAGLGPWPSLLLSHHLSRDSQSVPWL